MRYVTLTVAAYLAVIPALASAQTTPPQYKKVRLDRLVLTNGNIIDGNIRGENETEILIEVKGILLGVRKEFVKRREIVELNVRAEIKPQPGSTLPTTGRPGPGPTPPGPRPPGPPPARTSVKVDVRFPDFDPAVTNEIDRQLARLVQADEATREAIVNELAAQGSQAQIYLVKRLPELQAHSRSLLTAIGRINSDAAFSYLEQMLPALSDETRGQAITVLGAREYQNAADAIAKYLDAENSSSTRQVAVIALARLDAIYYAPRILQTLRDADPELGYAAVQAIVEFSKRHNLKSDVTLNCLQLLDSENKAALLNGATLARRIGVTEAGPQIDQLLLHEDREVRLEACKAIRELKYRPAAETAASRLLNEADLQVKLELIATVGNLMQGTRELRVVPALIERLDDEDTKVRDAASAALTSITGQSLGADSYLWQEWYNKTAGNR